MENLDFLGIGKPLEKLIDVVSAATGRLLKQHFDKKDIDTEAYRIKELAIANAKAEIEASATKEESLSLDAQPNIEYRHIALADRAAERVKFQEAKKQLNIENVVAFAAQELKDETVVPEEPVDEDWTTRFFRIVEDVSNEEMQRLWAKILAGEIKQPNTFSLRTLEIVRNLSQKEAIVFAKVSNFAVCSKRNGNYFLFKGNDSNALGDKYGISYRDITLLVEIGLMQAGDMVHYNLLQQQEDVQEILTSGNIIIFIDVKANTSEVSMPVSVFSKAGNELIKLITQKPNLDYLSYIAKSIIKDGKVDVKYSYITACEGDIINYKTPLKNF